MDHDHMDMGMGDMNMGDGVPGLFYTQQMYWAVVGAAIAVATVANVLNNLIAVQRFADSSSTPSKPKSILFSIYATITAMTREVSYASFSPIAIRRFKLHFPPLGRLLIILANLVTVIVLCFYKLDTMDEWSWENVGYRTGFIAIAQLPLVILLAGKTNIIGFLTGSSYERLNWFHRWVSRTLWLVTTIHMGFWFRSWGRYDYIVTKLTTDTITQKGFSAWCILTFIVLVSMAPVRRLSYELFVLTHLLTFAGFIAAVWYHAPNEVKVWVWIPIGLVAFDRVARGVVVLYSNLSIFHPSSKEDAPRPLWANRATFTPLDGNVTRVTVPNPVISWKPGQHVFLSCHGLVPLQSHPLSIASIPTDNKLEFLVRAHNGGTKKFFAHASKHHSILGEGSPSSSSVKLVGIEGPYGRIRRLRQFDSVVLLAGGMGVSYTMPLMRDIVEGWKNECLGTSRPRRKLPLLSSPEYSLTNRIRFVWVIRARCQLGWFVAQLQSAVQDMDACRQRNPEFNKELEISIYITCDEDLSSTPHKPQAPPQLPVATEIQEKNIETISIDSTRSTTQSDKPAATCCLPDGGCCCTRKVTDETASFPPCNCSGPSPPSKQSNPQEKPPATATTSTSTPSSTSTSQPLPEATATAQHLPSPTSELDNRVRILSGRPDTREIIRKVLEAAEGESGVAVCGPPGLNDDVRQTVVSLSDERAVHKGTGAQGIYLHVESFGY
ncbi:hypothetical protein FQN52_004764 [Onygenales sp. PD_12]|nr:hypothetical protein FQN52_004764 [Onygenales sp. PD_12]